MIGGKVSGVLLFLCLIMLSNKVFAQTEDSTLSSQTLKKLSLEELMNVEVTSLSMRPEKLTEVASAIQVITGEDIHRSGVTRLPEAMRLASNLQIAQANSHDFAITARGFNGLPAAGGILANKLQVTIDGRSVYTPLLGGVYWDVQNVMLPDLDRVEVVSGPGGTLWGANAVNGVINVVSKTAKETQGLYVSGASGSFLQDQLSMRYGFRLDSNIFMRVYAQRFDQRNTILSNGNSAQDAWNMTQGGFRMDYYMSKANTLTVQGDVYAGNENDSAKLNVTNGQNILARFTHDFSPKSNLTIKAYYDRTYRTTPNQLPQPFNYELNTFDLDIQHHFVIGKRQNILWGVGYRFQKDNASQSFTPLSRDMPLYSTFIQDEISLVPDRLKLTIGSKFLNNVFTGFEYQPSARMTFTPNKRHTVWTAVSRAVRIPSRFDSDITITPIKFTSEKVIAYELGYRVRPVDQLTLSFSTFYNRYYDLRSLDSFPSVTTPIVVANSQMAESYGFEFSGNFQATDWWRVRGGYTFFSKRIWSTSSGVFPLSVEFEGVDPKNIVSLQSIMDLSNNLQFDLTGRYVDVLPQTIASPLVPSYYTFDARIAWVFKAFEISLVGQNLLQNQHTEVGTSQIPRTVYGKVVCQF